MVLPCRNEEKAIARCIDSIKRVFDKFKIDGEIIVSDSSSDDSPNIARELGAKVVKHGKKGYGVACIEGLKAARGRYIFMADSDGSYDFDDIPRFLDSLKKGNDLVIGDRFKGEISEGSMHWLHKHLGNPVLSFMLSLFFGKKIKDAHCGMRAITKEAFDKLELKTTGMEFASEMIVKAISKRLKIKQLPINYHRREGTSKLRSFRDGWRHMRFMLMYAPDYLFLLPGLFFFLSGFFIIARFLIAPLKIGDLIFYMYPTLIGSFFVILGYQIIILGLFAKTYAVSAGFMKNDRLVEILARFINFESGIVFGAVLLIITFLLGLVQVLDWIFTGFPSLQNNNIMILILTLGIISVQTLFSAFFMSLLLVGKD